MVFPVRLSTNGTRLTGRYPTGWYLYEGACLLAPTGISLLLSSSAFTGATRPARQQHTLTFETSSRLCVQRTTIVITSHFVESDLKSLRSSAITVRVVQRRAFAFLGFDNG
jgi:hypothetical protein